MLDFKYDMPNSRFIVSVILIWLQVVWPTSKTSACNVTVIRNEYVLKIHEP